MKSERRHELKTNDMARGLEHLPDMARRYGTRILLGVILVVLVVVIILNRLHARRAAAQAAHEGLASAQYALSELRSFNTFQYLTPEGDVLARIRQQLTEEARNGLSVALGQTGDTQIMAAALVAQGDLNWLVATLPPVPAATTRPSLNLEPEPAKALDLAEKSYQQVLSHYGEQRIAAIAARFGLAAIAENNKDWTKARTYYDTIANDPDVPTALKTQASVRLTILAQLQNPILLAKPSSQPATQPTTAQAATPTTAPTTQP
ncbi:MAG: hypothetical protein IT447_04740 [Phycisphaerales bacterium]|jgi:hypothetical protein|nr:hypothetical protein [Phycisphaerales bacterium]